MNKFTAGVAIDTPTLIHRISRKDRAATRLCVKSYGNFIWALAQKFTASKEEAEAATEEIFEDIWRYSKRSDIAGAPDDAIISLIARRRLFKYLM